MKSLAIIVVFTTLFSTSAKAQDCEGVVKTCEAFLRGTNKKSNFVSDGQVYSVFLDREKGEFKTTFFGGATYRIVTSAGNEDDYVIFTVRDLKRNILFTNKKYKNSPYWDFKVQNTIPVIIETEFDLDKKVTGCAVMLIGFKQ
jgi:hypothetical protein